jgi:fatty acid desaturase
MPSRQGDPIPGWLNITLVFSTCAVALLLLTCASRVESWPPRLLAAAAFSFVNNTVFSLLHESVHGILHPNEKVNDGFGRITAAFFPTAFTFQRLCHLGHHRRNRTDEELFDYYLPGDNRPVKWLQWYGILTGIYWLLSPAACALYLLCPWIFRPGVLRGGLAPLARQTSASAMLTGLNEAPITRIRLEVLLTVLVQVSGFAFLDWSVAGWATCYGAFAINWSSLQYADHAWSGRDVWSGAWNLRVNPLVRALFLNYHHHRAHHQRPHVPWIHLPRYVDFDEPRPSFLSVYLKMWRGPRPYPGPSVAVPTLVDRLDGAEGRSA